MLDDYLISTDGIDADHLLAEWRWLVGTKPIQIIAIAAIGNLFLQGESGRVYLLDIEHGVCDVIADSARDFRASLEDRHNRRAWLCGFLVREMRRQAILLSPGECYGRKVPMILGGKGGTTDLHEPIGLAAHVSILGQLHRQLRETAPEY